MPAGTPHAPRASHHSPVVEAFAARKAEAVRTGDPSVAMLGSARSVAVGAARVKNYGGDPELLELRDLRVPVEGPSLDDPAYSTRVRLPKYNFAITFMQACSARDAANVLIWAKPEWTQADHAALSVAHGEAAEAHSKIWNDLADRAAMEAFGTPFLFEHYRISGIGSESFSDDMKDALRHHAHCFSRHRVLKSAHEVASTSRRLSRRSEAISA